MLSTLQVLSAGCSSWTAALEKFSVFPHKQLFEVVVDWLDGLWGLFQPDKLCDSAVDARARNNSHYRDLLCSGCRKPLSYSSMELWNMSLKKGMQALMILLSSFLMKENSEQITSSLHGQMGKGFFWTNSSSVLCRTLSVIILGKQRRNINFSAKQLPTTGNKHWKQPLYISLEKKGLKSCSVI